MNRESDAQEDYLIRLIRQVIQALANIARLRSEGRQQEALVEIEEAYQELLGLEGAMLRLLGPATLAAIAKEKGVEEPLARLQAAEAAVRLEMGLSADPPAAPNPRDR